MKDSALNGRAKPPGSRPPFARTSVPRQSVRPQPGRTLPKKLILLRKLAAGFVIAVGVILFECGVVLVLAQIVVLVSWPAVQAEVTSNQVLYQDGSYQPEAEFRYTVRGATLVSKAVLGRGTSGYPQAKRRADQYSPGSRHAIRYDPRRPSEIVADAGYTPAFFRDPLLVGGIGILVVLLTCRFGFRTRQPAKRRDPRQRWRVAGVFFAALGIVVLAIAGRKALLEYSVVKNWPATEAQVVSHHEQQYLEFRYLVAGKEFVSPPAEELSPREADRARAVYPVGSRHEIRYNPRDPNEIRFSVNATNFSLARECVLPGVGVLLAGIGGGILYYSWKRKRSGAAG